MIDVAYAMGQNGAGASSAQAAGGIMSLVPMILIFIIFYFLLIRPQQKKAKEQQEMIKNLKVGDQVMTTGGIYGRIVKLDDTTLSLEIAEKVKIKVNRGNVNALVD